ncbi:exocrine gland-secreted peptide 1-like [Grammomys surdaster]|uniref:exocrine gland-secreted peptide 1-like n=1 Tax=Grammomys surdaster TaxID=491861 RepID=UPI00109FA681|nr:exocrine gland-secreted peptide 1-like [Grammomys surdaster]
MAPLPVMLFLITLLLPSMHTEGMVLTETQKDFTTPSNRKTNHKAVLDKTDHKDEGNIQAPKKEFSASNQDGTLFEDLANANQHELNLSKKVMAQSNCCTQKHQVDPVKFSHMDNRLQGTRVRHQRDNLKQNVINDLDQFFDKEGKILVSRKSFLVSYLQWLLEESLFMSYDLFVNQANKKD